MYQYGSIVYAMDRARRFVDAAIADLDQFEDGTPKRALMVAAEYMVTRDR
jgi:octaprenyl-diphosphate synthase